jgi:hypothetical protein
LIPSWLHAAIGTTPFFAASMQVSNCSRSSLTPLWMLER